MQLELEWSGAARSLRFSSRYQATRGVESRHRAAPPPTQQQQREAGGSRTGDRRGWPLAERGGGEMQRVTRTFVASGPKDNSAL